MHNRSPIAEAFFSGHELSTRVLDSLHSAVIVTDLSGSIQVWNQAAERLYGWRAQEVIGRNVVDVVPSAISRGQAADLMVQLTAGESWSGEFEVQRKDGSTFRAHVTDSPLHERTGALIGVVGVSVVATPPGRTEPGNAEAARRKRVESGLRFLSEASRVLTASLDYEGTLDTIVGLAVPYLADYCILYLGNEAGDIERVLGLHSDRAQEHNLQVVMRHHTPDPHNANNPTVRAMRTQRPSLHLDLSAKFYSPLVSETNVLEALIALDGLSGIVAPVVVRGQSLGALWLVRNSRTQVYDAQDVEIAEEFARLAATAIENARLYEAAERAREHAQEANRSKAHFIAVMSHELRTPLNAISGYIELLSMELNGPLAPEQHAHIGRIKSNQQRITNLLNDLLDFAKVETGHVSFDIGEIGVAEVLADIESMISPQLVEKGMSLEVADVSADVLVCTDRARTQQILLNLLSNAVKFSPAGSRVSVTCELSRLEVCIAVADKGHGIPAEKLDAIFDPFTRLPTPGVRRVDGAGLGLAISRDLARSMGADLTVTSIVGEGSVFTLRLPRA